MSTICQQANIAGSDGLLHFHSIGKSFVHENCRMCSPFKVFFSQCLCQDPHYFFILPASGRCKYPVLSKQDTKQDTNLILSDIRILLANMKAG